ncbi:MAG: hypothetical protein GY770_33535, partial [Aestuariibacter sp.]|nr:hypothetical protein [Aestuariibacter sp.]
NDLAVFSGEDTGTVTEDESVTDNNLVTSGTLEIVDPDALESSFVAETVAGSYGEVSINTAGNWTYSVDNSLAAIQGLNEGETLTDRITVRSIDGTSHDVVVRIYGAGEYIPVTVTPAPIDDIEDPVDEVVEDTSTEPEQSTDSDDSSNPLSSVIPDELQGSAETTRQNNQGLQAPVKMAAESQSNDPATQRGEAEPRAAAKEYQPVIKTHNLTDLLKLQAHKDQLANQATLSSSDFDLKLDDEIQLWEKIDAMQREMDESSNTETEVEIKVALGSTVGLTTGFIAWILRGGSLLASMMSTLPVLNKFDPLPILKTNREKIKTRDKNSTENESEVDRLFSRDDEDDS